MARGLFRPGGSFRRLAPGGPLASSPLQETRAPRSRARRSSPNRGPRVPRWFAAAAANCAAGANCSGHGKSLWRRARHVARLMKSASGLRGSTGSGGPISSAIKKGSAAKRRLRAQVQNP